MRNNDREEEKKVIVEEKEGEPSEAEKEVETNKSQKVNITRGGFNFVFRRNAEIFARERSKKSEENKPEQEAEQTAALIHEEVGDSHSKKDNQVIVAVEGLEDKLQSAGQIMSKEEAEAEDPEAAEVVKEAEQGEGEDNQGTKNQGAGNIREGATSSKLSYFVSFPLGSSAEKQGEKEGPKE